MDPIEKLEAFEKLTGNMMEKLGVELPELTENEQVDWALLHKMGMMDEIFRKSMLAYSVLHSNCVMRGKEVELLKRMQELTDELLDDGEEVAR